MAQTVPGHPGAAIVFAADRIGERLGRFHRCPWSAVYEVRGPVTLGGTYLLAMRHFTFDLLGEAYGGPYAHRVLVSVIVVLRRDETAQNEVDH